MSYEHAAGAPGVTDAGKATREALAAAGDTVLVRNLDATVERSGVGLLRRAECLAGALIARGQAGGTIGLYFRNSAAAVEAFIATELIGATRLPVEPSAANVMPTIPWLLVNVKMALICLPGAVMVSTKEPFK